MGFITLALGLVVTALAFPAFMSVWICVAFVIGLVAIAVVLSRNKWRKSAIAAIALAVFECVAGWNMQGVPKWRKWATELPTSVPAGLQEAQVADILRKNSRVLGDGKYGFNGSRYIDIAPKGFVLTGDYWRIVLNFNSTGQVQSIETHQIEP